MTDEVKLILSLIITGIVVLLFYLFINKLEILWTSYAFIMLGLIVIIYNFFTNKIYLSIASILILFIISFNIYITAIYNDKISDNKVPVSYIPLSISNSILLFIEIYVILNSILATNVIFDKLKLTQIGFLVCLGTVINITQMITLKSFPTDG